MIKYLYLFFCLCLMSGCGRRMDNNPPGKFMTGTIKYLEFEGGFYGIIADDSTNYNPINLPENFREDGLRVRFRCEPRDVATFQMWGITIEILQIERE